MENNDIKHVTSDPNSKQSTGSNPLAGGLNISVSIPESVDIKLVNASALTDFEIWIYISSLLSNAVVGFWISYAQNTVKETDKILFWNSIIFTTLFGLSIAVAIYKRFQLSKKSKKYSIQNDTTNG